MENYQATYTHSDTEYQALLREKNNAISALETYMETHNYTDSQYNYLLGIKNTAQSNYEQAQQNYEDTLAELNNYESTHSKTDEQYAELLAAKEQAERDLASYSALYTKTTAEYDAIVEALNSAIDELNTYKSNHTKTNEEYQALVDAKSLEILNNTHTYSVAEDGETSIFIQFGTTAADDYLVFTKSSFMGSEFLRDGNNLIIKYKDELNYTGETGTLTITNYFTTAESNRVDTFVDKNGKSHSISDIDAQYCGYLGTEGNNSFDANQNGRNYYTYSGNDTIRVYSKDTLISAGEGDDTISFGCSKNNTAVFNSGDGNDTVNWANNSNATTHVLKFTDVKFEDLRFVKDSNNLKVCYTDDDSVSLTSWLTAGQKISKITDSTGLESQMLGGSASSENNTFTANAADNAIVFDFFPTDNDTLTISDTNAENLHVVANFKADGTLDGNGLRVLSDENYTAWKSDATSVNGGVQVVSELGSVENIKSADGFTVTASELSQLQSDVSAWLTSHTDYADVASAIANKANDTEVADLVAIFDNFNTNAWGS